MSTSVSTMSELSVDRVEGVVPRLVELLAQLGDRPQRRVLASGGRPPPGELNADDLADVVRGLALAVALTDDPRRVLTGTPGVPGWSPRASWWSAEAGQPSAFLLDTLPEYGTDEMYDEVVAAPEYQECVRRYVPVLAALLAAAPRASHALGALAGGGPVFGTGLACGVMVAAWQ